MAETNEELALRLELASQLQDLLEDARKAMSEEGTHAQRMACFDKIKAFRSGLPRKVRQESTLDEMSDEVLQALLTADRGASLESLRTINTELKRLISTLDGVSATAEAGAATIRLDLAKRVVESTTEAVSALKVLRDSVSASAGAEELVKSIERAIGSIQKIRSEIESA